MVRLASDAGAGRRQAGRARLCGAAPSRAIRPSSPRRSAADIAAWSRCMRRLLTFPCEGAELGATLDAGEGETGLLLVTGGSQTRIGSHRMYERLAKRWRSAASLPSLRPARGRRQRGRGSRLPRQRPRPRRRRRRLPRRVPGPARGSIGFGLCDGATALALFGDAGRARRADPGQSLAGRGRGRRTARRRRSGTIIGKQLSSLEGWKKILSGAVDYRKLLRGVRKICRAAGRRRRWRGNRPVALSRQRLPVQLILAAGDATAIAAEARARSRAVFRRPDRRPRDGSTRDSHTFARPGDEAALVEAVLAALDRLDAQAS